MRIALFIMAMLGFSAYGQIASSNMISWSAGVTVGIDGGVPERTTVYTNLPTTASASDISTAIQNCPSNQVVQLTNGTFTLTSYIDFGGRDGVTLRGHPSGTILQMTNSGIGLMFLVAGTAGAAGQTTLGIGTNLISGYTKGSTNIVAETVSGISAGDVILITQDNDTNFVIVASGSKTNGSLRQRVHVQSVDAGTSNIVFWPPLVWTMQASLRPRLYVAGNQIERVGVENITWLPKHSDISVIGYFNNARECWFTGNYSTNIGAAGVELNWTLRCQVSSNWIYGTSSTADGYGIKVNSDTSSALVEDNVLGDSFAGIIASQHSGCVFAYNFSTNNWVDNGFVGMTRAYNCNHGPHAIMSLWEGNVGNGFLNDGYHGSGSHQTIFRNYFPATQTIYSNAHLVVVDLRRWSYYQQVVGNVLGQTWATNHAKYYYEATEAQWLSAPSADNGTIYLDGNYTSPYDTQVGATATKVMNYDYWNQGIVNSNTISSASLYRSSRPSWFGGIPWPPIGPDVSGLYNKIPAEYRFYGETVPPLYKPFRATTVRVGTVRKP